MSNLVTVSEEAKNFIKNLLEENEKEDHGVRIYLAGMGCAGPQFGMAFQDGPKEGDNEEDVGDFSFYFDEETAESLNGAMIDYVETPEGGGLVIQNPNLSGCSACGGGCN
ncbi:MAG: HesB/IscA family protein [Methanomassiliicoccales archaeon]